MITSRRTFTKEFKESTIELLLSSEKTAIELSRELGIRAELIYRWKREYLDIKDKAFPGSGKQNLNESELELKKLRRENMELEEERDILKKALAIFSKRSR
jgi:transposase